MYITGLEFDQFEDTSTEISIIRCIQKKEIKKINTSDLHKHVRLYMIL